MSAPRDAAVAFLEALGSRSLDVEKARVTAVNVGPPKSVDVRVNDKYDVPKVRYLLSYAAPAVDDAVYVLRYGSGKRLVIGEEA